MLRQVGLADKAQAYPEQLSGGQQQRVAIARSLAMEPQVMLFDEVTSALDPQLTGEVLKVIEDLAAGGMTMVLVTHEMAFARKVADTVIFMHEGRIWETGTGDMLLNPQTAELQQFVDNGLITQRGELHHEIHLRSSPAAPSCWPWPPCGFAAQADTLDNIRAAKKIRISIDLANPPSGMTDGEHASPIGSDYDAARCWPRTWAWRWKSCPPPAPPAFPTCRPARPTW